MNYSSPALPKPWYKQAWLWFILAPLIATFAYLSVFITLSVTTSDGLVHDDYRKQAKEISLNQSKDQIAAQLNLQASLRLDTLTGDLNLELQGQVEAFPGQLTLEIIHPTQSQGDLFITLQQQRDGHYAGSLETQLTGKKYLFLLPPDQSWRLHGEAHAPYGETLHLTPKALH